MMRYFTLFFALTFTSITITAQSLMQKKADQLYNELSYLAASDYYKSLTKTNKPTQDNLRKLATSYFKIYDFKNAEAAYKRLFDSFPSSLTETDLINYLQCLKYNQKYADVGNVLNLLDQKHKGNLITKNHNKNKNYFKDLKQDSLLFKILNVEKLNTEYSEFSPVFFNKNTSLMLASNRRNTSARNKTFAWDNSYFIDLYTSQKKDSLNFESTTPLPRKVSGLYHDGPVSLSSDAKTLYLTKSNVITKKVKGVLINVINLKLVILKKDSTGKYSNSEEFPYNSNDYSVGHAAVSKDGKLMYFISDMPGGYGQTDIYVSEFKNGIWQKPENLGQVVNTEGREMFPYVNEDGTLFFSSDGRAGLGGLDLYFTVPGLDAYFEPQNLGFPINTSADDFGFTINEDLKTGYLSSNRSGGKGKDDIYFFRSNKPLIGVTLSGMVINEGTKEMIPNAWVYLLNANKTAIDSIKANEKAEYKFTINNPSAQYYIGAKEPVNYYDRVVEVQKLKIGENKMNISLFPKYQIIDVVSNIKTAQAIEGVKATYIEKLVTGQKNYLTDAKGTFSDIIKGKKIGDKLQFSIKYEKKGFITVEKNYEIILEMNTIIELKEKMQPMEIGADIAKVIQIAPIYFDLNKWNIRSDAAKELDKIVKVMMENPSMTIELGSHTDCRSSRGYNLSLSDKRAKSSAAYIVSKGIAKNRIVGKGYGEEKPVNGCKCEGKIISNCSEEEHQANRRTEFLITKF
ncbi:MAG: OmpA family protein [Bacteroidetes bacterium]|nr:OmpA family protein [Bacteroidota bacterium]